MSVSVYLKEDYEDFHAFEVAKKQSQFVIVQRSVFGGQRYGFVIPVKTGIQTC